MKKVLFSLLLTGTAVVAQNVPASLSRSLTTNAKENSPIFDFYAVAPRNLNGFGFGMGGFSPALRTSSFGGPEIRFGGDFFFTGLDRKTIKNVPLLSPQTGTAKVKLNESMFALDGVVRISFPWSAVVSPYVDGFAGLRYTGANITVTSDQYQPGYERSTSDNLDDAIAFHYGVAGGLMVSVTKDIKLNAGVVFSRSNNPGKISNIQTANMQGSGLVMDKKALSSDVMIFKLGLTFRINTSKLRNDSHTCECCGQRIGGSTHSGSSSFPSGGGKAGAPNRVGIGVMK
jgi:hypothetical protein